jgi:hypothetical protein
MTLLDKMQWTSVPLPAPAAAGTLPLMIGEVGSDGPTALITAGVHGDEGPWGAWAVRQLLQSVDESSLRGRLRVVPAANPLAMEADLRNAPVDQLDLNRAFPGDADGSYTERTAHLLVEQAISGADYVIDLHGGGSWCVNAFVFNMEGGEALSGAFDAPFSVTAPDRSSTLTGYARSQGATVAAVEMGGRSAYETHWAGRIAAGLHRALAAVGVLADSDLPPRSGETVPVSSTTVLRPSSGGVFVPEVGADQVGTVVEKGTRLGSIMDATCRETLEVFEAPFDRTALLLLRPFITRIEGGAMTYVIAEPLQ